MLLAVWFLKFVTCSNYIYFYDHLLAFCGKLFYKSIIEAVTLRISPERPRS